MSEVCAEIQFGSLHSDLCPPNHQLPVDPEMMASYRQLLHDCLDEWLTNSGGDGHFYVGDASREHA